MQEFIALFILAFILLVLISVLGHQDYFESKLSQTLREIYTVQGGLELTQSVISDLLDKAQNPSPTVL